MLSLQMTRRVGKPSSSQKNSEMHKIYYPGVFLIFMHREKLRSYGLFKSDVLELFPFLEADEPEIIKMYNEYKDFHAEMTQTMTNEDIIEKVYDSYDERHGIVDVSLRDAKG